MNLSALSSKLPTRPQAASVQVKPADIGGYYKPDDVKASAALRPSQMLTQLLAALK